LNGALWGSDFGRRYPSLENEVYLKRADAKWEPQTRAQFLTDAFNLLGEAFNQPAFSVEQFLQINR
jgi:hypothetical protein